MFWKRYYKSFPVRMEIIANDAIIVFRHLIEVAIFAVRNFFSLFGIAIFNIPISHIIIVLLFLLQSYNLFSYFQTFFNFFRCWCVNLQTIVNFVFPLCLSPPFSGGVFRRCVPVVSCVPAVCRVRRSPDNHTRANTYAHTRTRTGIFR